MEWYTCANIIINDKSIIIHTGLYHSYNIIILLKNNYNYSVNFENGINNINNINNIKNGCINIPDKINSSF